MHAEKTICLSNFDFREFWSKSAKYNNVTAILGTFPDSSLRMCCNGEIAPSFRKF